MVFYVHMITGQCALNAPALYSCIVLVNRTQLIHSQSIVPNCTHIHSFYLIAMLLVIEVLKMRGVVASTVSLLRFCIQGSKGVLNSHGDYDIYLFFIYLSLSISLTYTHTNIQTRNIKQYQLWSCT